MMDFEGKSDAQKVKLITSHFGYAKNRRKPFEPLWEAESKIFLPRRYDFLRNDRRGQQYGAKVFSGHPASSANKCALGILNYMASKSVPWLAFGSSNQRAMREDNAKKYYQDCAEQILWSFNKSTFFGSSVWYVKDGIVIGTACSFPEYNFRDDKVMYRTVHPGDSYVEDDEFGQPCVYFRTLKRTAIQLYAMVGKDKLDDEIVAAAEGRETGKNPFTEYEVLMAVYKNKNYSEGQTSKLPQDGANKLFYILLSGKDDNKKLIQETGIDYFPLLWRYGKEDGLSYGTSLAADALTSALVDNKLAEKGLLAVHKSVENPLMVHENLRGKLRVSPGGRTYYNNPDEKVYAMQEKYNWPLSDAQMDRIHTIIEDIFFVRFFEMISNGDLPQITAYQVRQMLGEKATLMSSMTESFEESYLQGAVEAQWNYETQAGRMPDPPDILLDPQYGDGTIDTEYVGPLSQLQKSVLKSKGIIDGIELIARIGDIWPQSLVKVNEMELIEEAGVAQGMQQSLFKSDEELDAIMQAQAQKEQMQEALAAAGQMGQANQGLSKGIEPDSPLALMGAQL